MAQIEPSKDKTLRAITKEMFGPAGQWMDSNEWRLQLHFEESAFTMHVRRKALFMHFVIS